MTRKKPRRPLGSWRNSVKYIEEFRRGDLARKLIDRIKRRSAKRVKFMEFCGTHTVSVFRFGIRGVLPENIEMLSGPGCPVCVTDQSEIDMAIALSEVPGVIITTFGDMMKVPGSKGSLSEARARGRDVRVVYSPDDALKIAMENPARDVVFLGIGFETTAPSVASVVLEAEERGIKNFYILPLHKLTPPIMKAILDLGEVELSGIICPGHVSTVIGSLPWEFIPREYGIAAVIAGFEPLDILMAIDMLVGQIEEGKPRVEIAYRRSVRPEGNRVAQEIMYKVFEVGRARWRGIGEVEGSGLKLRKEFMWRDASLRFEVDPGPPFEAGGCICGEILRGIKKPPDCPLFAKVCTPENPMGPCMVSSEGTCSAYYLYREAQ